MIIYNKTWLTHLQLLQQAQQLHRSGCVTTGELKAIKEKYPVGFYTPGIFVRIGLFILTCVILLASSGLLSLMLAGTRVYDSFAWPLFLGLAGYAILEHTVRWKNHYRSGVDDALLWMSAASLTVAFIMLLYSLNNTYPEPAYFNICTSSIVFVLGVYFTLRFNDLLAAAIAALSFFIFLFFSWKGLGAFGMATMPVFMMVAAALAYFSINRLRPGLKVNYYQNALNVAQVTSLIVLYAAGNYYIADELGSKYNAVSTHTHAPVQWGLFFWLWTMLLPWLYLLCGIIKKDALLLRTGLLLIAASVYTFRSYCHVMPIETALTLGGMMILAIVYAIIKYLRENKYGFTIRNTNDAGLAGKIQLEALITAETIGHIHTALVAPAERFGGGDFGGGGSGGGF